MKNLELYSYNCTTLPPQQYDVSYYHKEQLYVANETQVLLFNNGTYAELGNIQGCLRGNGREVSKPVNLFLSNVNETMYVTLSAGDIISMSLNSSNMEYLGSIENGVLAASWGPSEDYLVIVTGALKMILMQLNMEVVSEVELSREAKDNFVNVGWGKKETQFRGKEGKLDSNNSQNVRIHHWDDKKVRISWRADGEYYVISFAQERERKLQIFDKCGVLQHTSEEAPGLESSLAWKPDGTLITSCQRLPNKYVVCFIEKNGLLHGNFTLVEEDPVLEVIWNANSTILCVQTASYLQLYTTLNYHWYVKYTIQCKRATVFWDPKNVDTLHILSGNQFIHYTYKWVVNRSQGIGASDCGWVAVIDEANLRLTSFRGGIIPPPMCTETVTFRSPINSVGFLQKLGEEEDSNYFFAQLSTGTILIYEYTERWGEFIPIKETEVEENIFNLTLYDGISFIGCKRSADFKKSILIEITLGTGIKELLETPHEITLIRKHRDEEKIFFADDHCQLSCYDLKTREVQVIGRTEHRLQQFEIANNLMLILDVNNHFFINNAKVAENVNSFLQHGNFVLFTTLEHKLKIWNLALGQLWEERNIESGAQLLATVPDTTKVILLMPRGNLECIQPRSLTISVLKGYLDQNKYRTAYSVMRKERINLNLLYDHDPGRFLQHIDSFLREIKDRLWICTFITDLIEEDVTTTMYQQFYINKNVNLHELDSKVDTVCKALERYIESSKKLRDKHLLELLTAQVKRKAVDKALCEIQQLQGATFSTTSELAALRHVLYLVDFEALYKEALGIYDLKLAHFVITTSKKDPKEYVPFLEELERLEPRYRKFTIDKFLRRHEKAVEHLIHCEEHQTECLNYIDSHKLYKHALRLFPQNTDRYKEVCAIYANHLLQLKDHEGAGIYYKRAGLLEKALNSFKNCLNWQEAIHCGALLNVPNMNSLYSELARNLENEKRFLEAASILKDYLKDIPEAVRILCQGHHYDEAFRVIELLKAPQLVESHVKPCILDYNNSLLEEIQRNKTLFQQQCARLRVVREKKKIATEEDLYEEEDTASTSASTRSTMRSRSSKNTRKLERKLLSLKEGSPYEDLALMASLFDLITLTVGLKSTVQNFNMILIKIDEITLANRLQMSLDQSLTEMEKSSSWIWPVSEGDGVFGSVSTSNSITNNLKRRQEASFIAKRPKLLFPPNFQNQIKWKLDYLY